LAADSIQEWALGRVIESLDRRGRILEIGCGSGGVVRELKRLGFDARCADIGCWHEELEGIVHTAGADLSRRLPFEDGAFGAVIGFEVLEHVTNPFNAASELARVLEKEGSLYLTLPNFWNVRARLREGRCPPHISTLPWPTLKYALASFGFRVEELVGYTRRPWRHLGGLPLAAAIWGLTRLTPGRRRERFELDETNRWSILYASRHVFVRARKVAAP
jgi:SAM-dependent methyltransferase